MRSRRLKIDDITLTELIKATERRLFGRYSTQDEIAQSGSVSGGKSQSNPEYNGFIPSDGMRGIKAIVFQLPHVDECAVGIGESHVWILT